MGDAQYTNQNLAGILSEALGLETNLGEGRSDFSSTNREALRRALDDASTPQTFDELLRTLERLEEDAEVVAAVAKIAADNASTSLQDYAAAFARGAGTGD